MLKHCIGNAVAINLMLVSWCHYCWLMPSVMCCLASLWEWLSLFPSLLSPQSLPSPHHRLIALYCLHFSKPVTIAIVTAWPHNSSGCHCCCFTTGWLLCCLYLTKTVVSITTLLMATAFAKTFLQAQVWHFCRALYGCSMLADLRLSGFDQSYDQSISTTRIPYLFVCCFYGAGQFVLLKWK